MEDYAIRMLQEERRSLGEQVIEFERSRDVEIRNNRERLARFKKSITELQGKLASVERALSKLVGEE